MFYFIENERGMNMISNTLKEIHADQKEEFQKFCTMYEAARGNNTATPSAANMSDDDLKKEITMKIQQLVASGAFKTDLAYINSLLDLQRAIINS